MRFYMWVNQSNDLNPNTPFTCGKEKKKVFDNLLTKATLQTDLAFTDLNKPLLILSRGKVVISGGHWDGYIFAS